MSDDTDRMTRNDSARIERLETALRRVRAMVSDVQSAGHASCIQYAADAESTFKDILSELSNVVASVYAPLEDK